MIPLTPLVSVIVPVYNVEPYLRRCLDSLLCQTMEAIEILIIDDGSTDGGGALCDQYAARDERIHVIHQSNQGLSAARNAGIAASIGKYIMFVDSDDWVEPDFCRIPFQLAEEHQADLVAFGLKEIRTCYQRVRPSKRQPEVPRNFKEALDICGSVAWNKLYRKELFDGVSYPEGYLYEDWGTTHKLIHAAAIVRFTNEVLYNYVVHRPGSITSLRTRKALDDGMEMNLQKAQDLALWGYAEMAEQCRQKSALSYLISAGTRETYSHLADDTLREVRAIPFHFKLSLKILFVLYRCTPALFDWICILFGRRMKEE